MCDGAGRTVLVEQGDIAAGKVDGVSSAQAGDCGLMLDGVCSAWSPATLTAGANDDDTLRHDDSVGM